MKTIALFGSTGSIGLNVLEIVRSNPDQFRVACLTACSNVDQLVLQTLEFRPEVVCLADESLLPELQRQLSGVSVRVVGGSKSLAAAARETSYDQMIGAIVGSAGLLPTIEAITSGRQVGLANKETLVVAGEIVNRLLAKHQVDLIPIDSEHSALFQCMAGENADAIDRLILTASGGPFLHTPADEFDGITPEKALKHPNWNMGAKITIDSATLMNKGLEIIEAHWLFGVAPDRIHVVVHPQSIIHSMVQFIDSSVKAQMGLPDMKVPIQYAMSYPHRIRNGFESLDLIKLGRLDFFEPDRVRFPCIQLAYDALEELGTMPAVLNAANEVAVGLFLSRQITFKNIPRLIAQAMDHHHNVSTPELEDVLEADRWARDFVQNTFEQV